MVRRFLRAFLVAGTAASITGGSDGGEVWWASCPYHLLDVEETGQAFSLSEEGLRYLSRQTSPLYVVPVLGVYRGGKSFLMNRVMGLRAPYSGGFGVGHSQDTHTRGIFVCAEHIEGRGTVIWMDTEGLFSSEYARSAYGPKIFSLALLFSSAVLLNSVKVLNEQFFNFFSEQQQVARVLRHGLAAEGLPEGDLLPRNLSITWILQQPIDFDEANSTDLLEQLDSFLDAPGDEAREHVRQDFRHHLHVVPSASHDVRLWSALDSASEEELSAAFVEATGRLRDMVLGLLSTARPLQADNVANQLRMYAQLVQTEQFSGKLVREALEEAELSSRCNAYGHEVEELAGEMPAVGLQRTLATARAEAVGNASEAALRYHFGKEWQARLSRCFDHRAEELQQRSNAALMELWQGKARQIAETSGCFFLDSLILMRDEDFEAYESNLSPESLDRTVKFAAALQRTRLVECLRLKHLIGPFVPWLAWPIIAFYIRSGVLTGLAQLAVHGVAAAGGYVMMRSFRQLPPYLDTEFPVLRSRPQLLDATMQVLPWMPWAKLGTGFGATGACWCGFKVLRALADKLRPAGDTVGGLVNLELKVNVLLERSTYMLQQQFLAALQDVHQHACQARDEQQAALALMRGLCIFRNSSGQDPQLCAIADARLRARINRLLDVESHRPMKRSWEVCDAWQRQDVIGCALRGDFSAALEQMVDILEANKRPHVGDSETAGADGHGLRVDHVIAGLHSRAQRYLTRSLATADE